MSLAQCVADYDFGTETLGVSQSLLGEQFDPGVIGLPYEDILHILLPEFVLDIDSTLPFFPDTPLDSASLSNIVLVDLDDTLSTTTLEAVGLEVLCNNNVNSSLLSSRRQPILRGKSACPHRSRKFQGGHLREGMDGYLCSISLQVQEEVFGSFVLSLGRSGCTQS